MKWICLSYSLPTKPSKARLHVWRQLKKVGAVNVDSFWVAPYSKEKLTELQALVEDIHSFNGSATIFRCKSIDEQSEEKIKNALTASTNEELTELIGVCEKFLEEIKSEIEKENFIFAEVEENDEELSKIKKWYSKIVRRSAYDSPLKKSALEKIKSCEVAFDGFSRIVFDKEDGGR